MTADPRCSDGMQPVRAAGCGGWNSGVAGGALNKHARVALHGNALYVVIRDWCWELRVGRAVAGLALQSAVTARRTEERMTGVWRVRIGGEGGVGRSPQCGPAGEGRRVRKSYITCACQARVARLAVGLVKPTRASGIGECGQVAVAALALDGVRARGGQKRSHCTAQALRLRSGMATVAPVACLHRIHNYAQRRVDHVGMKSMDGSSERLDSGNPSHAGEGVCVALIAENWPGRCRGLQSGRVIAHLRCGRLEEREALEAVVVQTQDVQLHVFGGIGVVDPTGGRHGCRVRTRGMASCAADFIRDRKHNVGARQNHALGARGFETHHRIIIDSPVIRVVGHGNANRFPGVICRAEVHWPRSIRCAWHEGASQTLIRSRMDDRKCEEVQQRNIVPEIRLADRRRVECACQRIGDCFIRDRIASRRRHQRP